MLFRRSRPTSGTRFIWGLPVYAVGCAGKPSGWVWGEHVAYETWDCWGHGGYNYTRIENTRLSSEWRAPRIPGP